MDERSNVVRAYVWGEGIDRLLAVKIGSRTYTALTDVQGTVWGYADEGGAIAALWTYDAWGNVLSEEVAPSAEALRSVRYRFQGRERSSATGLVNFRMRWYDPTTGRWLSKDPIGLGGGLNLYMFCGEDSVNNQDPLGLAFIARRPLATDGSKMQTVANAFSGWNLPGDLVLNHAEIFFEDAKKPRHIGYGPRGVCEDKSPYPYRRDGRNDYDDDIMRKAVANVASNGKWSGENYDWLLHNCQDFVSEVIDEYNRLVDGKK